MALAKLTEFRKRIYEEGSRPDMRTLRRWVNDGKIQGGIHDATGYWVDMDVYNGRVKLVDMSNPILRKIYGDTM